MVGSPSAPCPLCIPNEVLAAVVRVMACRCPSSWRCVNLDNGSEIHADAGFVRKGEGLFAVEGGTTTAIAEPTGIAVANATSFTVLVTAATDISSANFAWASSEDFAFVVADEHEPGSGASTSKFTGSLPT
jgi:hypothetical protein